MITPRYCLYISHYDDCKESLLRDCLVPIVERLIGQGTRPCYIERHWLRGPHVRLIYGMDSEARPDQDDLIGEVSAYLREHPSTKDIDEGTYLAQSGELGRAELILPPYGPIRPNNVVEFDLADSEPTIALLGEGGLRLKEEYFTRAMRPLAEALAHRHRGVPRIALAFRLMILNAERWPIGGLVGGELSYRSHLEDYLANNDTAGAIRIRLTEELERRRQVLLSELREVMDHSRAGAYEGPDAYLTAWSELFDEMWPLALAAAQRGELSEDYGPGYLERASALGESTERLWRFGKDRPSSDFHRDLATLNTLSERVYVVEFAAYRLLTNFLTRWLPLMDVSPIERYFVSLAISELVEEEHGVSWKDRLEMARRRARDRPESGPGL